MNLTSLLRIQVKSRLKNLNISLRYFLLFDQANYSIIKENTTANYIYLITRGQCTETVKETSFDFKQKLSLSSIVSYHQIICGRSRYLSSNILL